jgi:outer membrane protein assembly factor BamB
MKHCPGLAIFAALLSFLPVSGCSEFASSAQAQNAAQPPLEFVGQWGVKGDGPGQLDDPQGIAVDSIGNVYIADAGSGFVDKFASNGTPLLSFQENGLKEPDSIAVDSDGAIYVSDPGRGMVVVVFPTSEHDYHRVLRLRTRASSENSLSVAVDVEGVIYVLDENAGKIFRFSPRLRLERSWVPSAVRSADMKRAASMGPLRLGGDGNLYIADLDQNRLLRFDTGGRFLGQIPSNTAQADPPATASTPPAKSPFNPRISAQFAVSRNYVFVMDENGSTLHVWNLNGSPKMDVDLSPKLGQTHRPPALAVGDHRDLFVLDSPDCRVLRYRVNF